MYRKFFKRPMDVMFALIAIILLTPLLFFLTILIIINLGCPAMFRQIRPGLNGKLFTLYKFRTMSDTRDEKGELLPDSQRLNKFGRLLRSTSLDELPELFNILKGDMSFVGPRPLAVEYLPYYTELENRRHSVRPGLTGLAQINGRNTSSWEKRFSYDLLYVDNITLIGDIKIILKTVIIALRRSNIGERGIDVPVDFHEYRQKSKN